MKKMMQWQGRSGTITMVLEYTLAMKTERINSDGYEFDGETKPHADKRMMTISLNGKVVDTCWNENFWTCIEINDKAMNANGITHKIWGCKISACRSRRENQRPCVRSN